MVLSWTNPQSESFRDAYLDWSRLLSTRRNALNPAIPQIGTEFEPIFVRLVADTDARAQRVALQALADDASTPFLMDAHERDWLIERTQTPELHTGMPDEYALFRKVGESDNDTAALFTVLDTGSPVLIDTSASSTPVIAAFDPPTTRRVGAPIIALIDDGIGFLNTRFQHHDGTNVTSRFHALWLQAQEQYAQQPRGVTAGKMLDRDEIDRLINLGNEADTYAALNASLFRHGTRQPSSYGASHGTHILDLAAGAEPDDATDAVRDWPLLGVQLPPQAVEDTSGTRFESYLLQGLRWTLRQAAKVDSTAPVIVNISMGIVAGPKDGSRFVEYQMAREAKSWEEATGQPVRIVWAFGNHRRSDLVAHVAYQSTTNRVGTDRHVTWRAQPSDQTASYLEIYCRNGVSQDVQISLTAPDGTSTGFAPLAPGAYRTLTADNAEIARIYHEPDRDFGTGTVCPAHYVLALAPTEGRRAGEPEALAGAWSVDLRYRGADALDVSLEIQRDDSLHSAAPQARQSYFDDPAGYGWDSENQSHVALGNACAVTYEGTHSALVSPPDPKRIVSAGAAALMRMAPDSSCDNYKAAWYSAEGQQGQSVEGPSAATIAEEGTFQPGVIAAGTLSGSTRIANGTSAAAARLSRAFGLSAAKITRTKNDSAAPKATDALNRTANTLIPTTPEQTARLGDFIVKVEGGARTR